MARKNWFVFSAVLSGCALLSAALPLACGSSETAPPGVSTPRGAGTYSGVISGNHESGTLRVTIASRASAASLRPSAVSTSELSVTGTLEVGGVTIHLTGSFDPATGAFSMTGGGYAFSGTFGNGEIAGTYSGPNGSGSFGLMLAPASSTNAIELFCGSYEGDLRGVFNLGAIHGGAAVGVGSDFVWTGKWANDDALSVSGTSGSASGTLTDSHGNGTWKTPDARGTWTAAPCTNVPADASSEGGTGGANGRDASADGGGGGAGGAGGRDGGAGGATGGRDGEAGARDGEAGGAGGRDAATSLRVLSTVPAGDTRNASRDVKLTATFSADLNPWTVNSSTFLLHEDASGAAVKGAVTTNGATATFAPQALLHRGALYHATIQHGVLDWSLNSLAEDYDWSFATKSDVTILSPSQYGYVMDDTGKIKCGAGSYTDCQADYDYGSSATFTAVPVPGFTFLGWGGDDCRGFGAINPITLVMHGGPACAANFEMPAGLTFTMTVGYGPWVARVIDDTGYSSPADPRQIDCGPAPLPTGKCSARFPAGSSVEFVAYPNPQAPAGDFKWTCTSSQPFDNSSVYSTGTYVYVAFWHDIDCHVDWIPNGT